MPKRSNTVDAAVRQLWAKMATKAAHRALVHADNDRLDQASETAAVVERWLERAGADATRMYFVVN